MIEILYFLYIVLGENSEEVFDGEISNEAMPMERDILVIHRCNVKLDLLNYFVDGSVLNKLVDVKMIDPRGMEEKGEGVGGR